MGSTSAWSGTVIKKKRRNKLKLIDIQKKQARYDSKFEEFKLLSPEELKKYYTENKMSQTDRFALIHATDFAMKQLMDKPIETIING